jgi:Rrf2 family protein
MSLMQVSRKIDYVLRAAIYLARQETSRACAISEIAASEEIPKRFLEKILQDLIHQGIVVSRRGPHGGYSLARPKESITFRQVIEAVEGPVALNVCVGEQHDCSLYPKCGMLWVWQEAQRRVVDLFTQTTLADIPVPRTAIAGIGSANNTLSASV